LSLNFFCARRCDSVEGIKTIIVPTIVNSIILTISLT
jgi:hypothetical protein